MERRKVQTLGLVGVVPLMVAMMTLHAPAGQAQGPGSSLAERVAVLEATVANLQSQVSALQEKTQFVSVAGTDMYLVGANLHIVNGLGATNGNPGDPASLAPSATQTNGLGNLIVGYNEIGLGSGGARDGSHNLVVGPFHDFASFGGLVAGRANAVTGPSASVSGGIFSAASGLASSVSGGNDNTASGPYASVSGGVFNTASATESSVSGGISNVANGEISSVSGGSNNEASGQTTSVSGGFGISQGVIGGWSAGGVGPGTFIGKFRSP
jgi:hypothetical protein